jgi:flagellar motility protein MotE (MotC chaperone)
MLRTMKPLAALVSLSAALVLVACASVPRPVEELARAKSLVQQADAANAQRFAANELTQARDRLQAAEKADAQEENEIARKRANEASADAELASALARSRAVEQDANEQAQTIEALRDEIRQRGTSNKPKE